jgi:hypothetical protein
MTESDDSSRSRPNTGGAQARTKAEDLREKARRAVKLANAIADQETSRALNVYAIKLLEKADALERQGET